MPTATNYPNMQFTICNIPAAEVASFCEALPEFQAPYTESEIRDKLAGRPHLSLGAFDGERLAGFKLGYEREGFFYSWLGGVLPEYRRQGVARLLADAQEAWALQNGYASVTFKTRNRHKAMLLFALKNGFFITGFEAKEDPTESRIWLRKALI